MKNEDEVQHAMNCLCLHLENVSMHNMQRKVKGIQLITIVSNRSDFKQKRIPYSPNQKTMFPTVLFLLIADNLPNVINGI